MIVFQDCEVVKSNSVLYANSDAVRKLATMMIVNMAEGNTDMVCDMSEEYKTKAEVEAVFSGLNEQALDMLPDVIDGLKQALEDFLKQAKVVAQVRRLDYDTDGKLSDVTVDIKVE